MAVRAYALPGTSGVVGPLFQTNAAQGHASEKVYFKFLGFSLVETGGTSKVTMTITDSAGTVLAVTSAPTGSAPPPLWFGPEGVEAQGQLTVTYSGGGTPSGCVYIR